MCRRLLSHLHLMSDLLVPSASSVLSELTERPLCSPSRRPASPMSPAPMVLVLRITHLQAVGLAVGAALVLAGCLLSVQRCAALE